MVLTADILLLTYDYKLKLHSFPDVKNPLKPQTHQHSITEKVRLVTILASFSRALIFVKAQGEPEKKASSYRWADGISEISSLQSRQL